MLTFDRDSLKRRLDCVTSRSRTAFALACAERLMPLYDAFSERNANQRWSYLRLTANKLWEQLLKNTVVPNHEFLNEYPSLAPNDDWPTSDFSVLNPLAENAVLALGSAAECHESEDSGSAVLAAEQAYEAVDYLAQHAEALDYRDIGGEDAIMKAEVVQGELQRQMDALDMLENTTEQDPNYVGIIDSLREQSICSGESLKRVAQSIVKSRQQSKP